MRLPLGLITVLAMTTASFAQVLDKESPAGSLPAGATVQVKSNKCKSGIMIVTGGSNMMNGQQIAGGSARSRTCKA